MNKSSIKFLTDFGPLLIFFIVYKKNGNDLSIAIPPLIVATLISVCIVYFIEKNSFVPLLGAVLVSTFGGLTLYFKNPIFIYIKPTIINILFAIILLVGRYIFNKNFLKVLLNQALKWMK